MAEAEIEKGWNRFLRRFLLGGILVALLFGGLAVLGLKVYLATPLPADQLSRAVSSYLHQPFRVTGLHADGATLYLTGVSLANPSGFDPGKLVEADAIAIAPRWGDLLLGRRGFREITLAGLRLDLRKNNAGVWNFSGLQRLLGGKQPSGAELFIERFAVRKGSIRVNGQGIGGIGLQLSNLSTKGTGSAGIALAFDDPAGNHVTASGKARPGSDPALDLSLAAPAFSVANLAGLLRPETRALLQGGTGSLRVDAGLHHGTLRVSGRLDFNRLQARLATGTVPVTGNLTVSAAYDSAGDRARLESLVLTTGNSVRVRASGSVADLKGKRSYSADIAVAELDLAGLALLLPEAERTKAVIGGKLADTSFRLSGDASGLVAAAGSLRLVGCSLERGGQLLFRGLDSDVSLARGGEGFLVRGRLALHGPGGNAMLEALDAPFDLRLSRRMKPLMAEVPALNARAMGLPVTGRLGYRAAAADPLSFALRIPAMTHSSLQPLLKRYGITLASGNGSLGLDGKGRGARDFSALVNARLATLQGGKGETHFGLENGSVDSRLVMANGRFSAAGTTRFSGLSVGSGRGDGHFSFRYANQAVALEQAELRFAGLSAAIARLSARVAAGEAVAGATRYPLQLEISGGDLKQGRTELGGLSGSLKGGLFSGPRGGWLEGTADLSVGRAAWDGKPLGSPSLRAALAREGGRATLAGTLLGGALAGEISFKTAVPMEEAAFQLGIKGMPLGRAGELLPGTTAILPSDGLLDAGCKGRFSRAQGIAGHFDVSASGIAARGKGGKTLFSGAGVRLAGEVAGQRIALNDARVTLGEGLSLRASGTVSDPLSPKREGSFGFSLPATGLNGIIDPLVNMLPRFIQEASVDGSVALEGTLALHGGRQLLDGTLRLKNVLMEVSSQNFRTSGISGTLPFSLDLSGGASTQRPDPSGFNRKNYPALLKKLSTESPGGQTVTIASTAFGPLSLGEVTMQVSAGNGITSLLSLRSSLYDGALLGSGFVEVKNGIHYRSDLLISGLSLKLFCSTIPQIKDYISGRLDGVVSLNGEGGAISGLTGYSNLWVREGSGEKMLVSRTFLQKLAGKQLSGFFFRADRPFDQAEIIAVLEGGDLTFERLDISDTNLFGVRDLSVSVAPGQNRIALDHLLTAVKQAAVRGKAASGTGNGAASPGEAPAEPVFKWQE